MSVAFLLMSFGGILHRSGLKLDFFAHVTPVIFAEGMAKRKITRLGTANLQLQEANSIQK